MTEKQEQILAAALELFAKEGYKATSTSKVAKLAGVSEGLIFRHFENKDGLLEAIMKQGEEKVKVLFADIVLETDPKEVIRKTLNLGHNVINRKGEADFWKLQIKIKWELELKNEQKMEPLKNVLTGAFTTLKYPNPELEAEVVLTFLEGITSRFYNHPSFDMKAVVSFMEKKYDL